MNKVYQTTGKNAKPKLYFVFPYRGVGGVPVLFVRVGEYLTKVGAIDAYFVDYIDGAMAKMMDSTLGTTLVEYSDEKQTQIPEGVYVIFQSMTPWSIFPNLSIADSTKILFWNCHPFNLVPTLPGLRRQMQTNRCFASIVGKTVLRGWYARTRSFLSLLLSKHGILFMDKGNLETTATYLSMVIEEPKFLPIPIEVPSTFTKRSELLADQPPSTINIVWVGRVVDFKFYILKRTLLDLDSIREMVGRPIRFSIVGGGDYIEELTNVANQLKFIEVEFINSISVDALDEYLKLKADLLMAMGTSALEGAKLGIPTILLDFSYEDVGANYCYKWLYKRTGYSLGEPIGPQHMSSEHDTLLQRLKELSDDSDFHSRQCLHYVEEHHNLQQVSPTLLSSVLKSEVSWGDLCNGGYTKRGLLFSAFSLLRNLINDKRQLENVKSQR